MAGTEEVVRYAQTRGVPIKLFSDLGSVRTVTEVTREMERGADEVGLTVLLTVRGDPVLVLAPGDRRIHGGKVGRHFGARASEVSLATREEVEEATGYQTGVVPPFGHERSIPLLVDRTVLDHETLLYPAGAPDALVEVDNRALASLDQAVVGDWSVAEDEDEA